MRAIMEVGPRNFCSNERPCNDQRQLRNPGQAISSNVSRLQNIVASALTSTMSCATGL